MDDRFERRELLLHLGDMLEALHCLFKTGRPDAPVAQLAKEQDSLQGFEFLQALSPKMTVAEFGARVASAFFLWPKELLDMELNRNALASTVQHDLFDGNPDGWKAYAAHMQKKVKRFGAGLPEMKSGASDEPAHAAAEEASPVEASVEAARRSLNGMRPTRRKVGLGRSQARRPDALLLVASTADSKFSRARTRP